MSCSDVLYTRNSIFMDLPRTGVPVHISRIFILTHTSFKDINGSNKRVIDPFVISGIPNEDFKLQKFSLER